MIIRYLFENLIKTLSKKGVHIPDGHFFSKCMLILVVLHVTCVTSLVLLMKYLVICTCI